MLADSLRVAEERRVDRHEEEADALVRKRDKFARRAAGKAAGEELDEHREAVALMSAQYFRDAAEGNESAGVGFWRVASVISVVEDLKGLFEVRHDVALTVNDHFAGNYAAFREYLAADELAVRHYACRHVKVEHRLVARRREGKRHRVRAEIAFRAPGRADAADRVGGRNADKPFLGHHLRPVGRKPVVVGLTDGRDADAGFLRLFDCFFNG